MTPMFSRCFSSIRRSAITALLLFCATDASAIEVSPSPSYDGSYVVSWGTTLGCFADYYPPFFLQYCYWVVEGDDVTIATSGYALPVSGKPTGSYAYRVIYTLFIDGQPYDTYVVEGPTTVEVLGP
jgi:hypothetical protein